MLHMRHIAKRYGSAVALEAADLEVRRGEVMALLGENGAGKSTLVKILSGLVRPDTGTIEVDGRPVAIRSTAQAQTAGVAYVAQELSIVGTLSVAENIFLGRAGGSAVWRPRDMAKRARQFLTMVGLDHLDPMEPAGGLSVAERQLIEIARLLSRDAQFLILDEPTAALADAEIDRVKTVVKSLAAQGRSIIYVTHRLGEVFELSDRVTIIRNGRSFPPVVTREMTVDQLIERLLGRRLEQMFPPRAANDDGPVILSLQEVETAGLNAPVTIELRKGQIVGLAGQIGSGAGSVLKLIAGTQPLKSGSLTLEASRFEPRSIRDSTAARIAYCSADRKLDGIFAVRNLVENLTAPATRSVSAAGFIKRRDEHQRAVEIATFFGIDTRILGRLAGNLSGGNQQKVALGKWLSIRPRILLVEEPTRGVDVGARADIYSHLRALADEGMAIMFVSSDTQEVLGLADRIATFFHGRHVRTEDAARFTAESLMRDVTHPDQKD